jgi:cyclophilin family peptidyl-prolyl cis-trans isomerase
MNKLIVFISSLVFTFIASCNPQSPGESSYVLIETDYGDIKIRLYDETPLHTQNFLKLTDEDFYTNLSFHRVIDNFMIQGGDPSTRKKPKKIDSLATSEKIKPEFIDSLIHKKGALAAAREGDAVNPGKKSSPTQFYIVQGRKFTDAELDKFELQRNQQRYYELVSKYFEIEKQKASRDNENLSREELIEIARADAFEEYSQQQPFSYTDEQREIYKTLGGTPHLDGSYTVFGEVTEGFDVIDRIAAVETDNTDKPLKDVNFSIKIINK